MSKMKTINFKGKEYVLVSERVLHFNETYKNGSIQTELVSDTKSEMVIIKAIVIPDVSNPERKFTGYSQARWTDTASFVNKTSALENAETSAIGRALGFMGIGVIDSIASIDEINKAKNAEQGQNSKKQTAIPFEIADDGLPTQVEWDGSTWTRKQGISQKEGKYFGKPYDLYFEDGGKRMIYPEIMEANLIKEANEKLDRELDYKLDKE